MSLACSDYGFSVVFVSSCVYMNHNNPIIIGLKHNRNKKVTCKHVDRIELAKSDRKGWFIPFVIRTRGHVNIDRIENRNWKVLRMCSDVKIA